MDICEPSQPVADDHGSDSPFSTDWSSIDQENLWEFLKEPDPGGPPEDKSKPRVQDPVLLPANYDESLGWDFSIAHHSIVDALLGTAMSFGLEQGL